MDNELWPTMPNERTEPGVPNFPRWGEAAPLVAQSARLHSKMCTLASDIDDLGTRVSDPAVVDHLVTRLAGTGLSIAEILHSVSGKLDRSRIDLDHWLNVLEAFDRAQRAFRDACGEAQAAADVMRNHTQIPR